MGKIVVQSLVAFAGGMIVASAALAAATPAQKCQAAKNQEAGKYAACLTKARAKLITSGYQDKYDAAILKCATKLGEKYTKLEAKAVKAGGACPTALDSGAIDSRATSYADAVDAILGGERFVDNGDGTVSDRTTGLVWEKKSDDDSIHDRDNTYTWGDASPPYGPTGTAFAAFLAVINGGDGVNTCFAGYCDWRLPSDVELASLVDASEAAPTLAPAFKTPCSAACAVADCSCAAPAPYWSATTEPAFPATAIYVDFNDGTSFLAAKSAAHHARAVRSGL